MSETLSCRICHIFLIFLHGAQCDIFNMAEIGILQNVSYLAQVEFDFPT